MPINGPASLAAYHRQQMEQERKPVANTDFKPDEMDAVNPVAAARVREILKDKPEAQPGRAVGMVEAPQQTDAPSSQPASEDTKRTRTTVAGLMKKFKDQVEDLDDLIQKEQNTIAHHTKQRDNLLFKKQVLQELISEVTKED